MRSSNARCAQFKQHFSRSTNVDRGGVEEREIDYYANLEVVSIISWESYDVGARGGNKRATTLTPAGSSWTRADDELIQANELVMQAWR